MVVATLNLNFILVVTTNLKLKKEEFKMNEKEIKKIDEKGEEKISGGLKLDKAKLKKVLVTYGAPLMRPEEIPITRPEEIHIIRPKEIKTKEEKNPEDALTTSQPQDGEKK